MQNETRTETNYYKNGNIESIYNFKGERKHGQQTDFYEDGQLYSVYNFKDGKSDGIQTEYFENGQIESIERYIDGKKNGIQIEYFENGQIKSNHNYLNGMRDGKCIRYFDNGQVWCEMYYVNGNKHGKFIDYYHTGEIESEYDYDYGLIIRHVQNELIIREFGSIYFTGKEQNKRLNVGDKFRCEGFTYEIIRGYITNDFYYKKSNNLLVTLTKWKLIRTEIVADDNETKNNHNEAYYELVPSGSPHKFVTMNRSTSIHPFEDSLLTIKYNTVTERDQKLALMKDILQ